MHDNIAHIFVGSDRSQLLAVKVLEHSIRRHTDMEVHMRSMHDLDLPNPKDKRQRKRTGFSFTRFAIPQLMGYNGVAVYLDADMLVFRDFRELLSIPFDGAKIVIQEDLTNDHQKGGRAGPKKKRVKQCSVMLFDCESLDWDPLKIIAGLDGKYTYEELLYQMCILDESEIKYGVPFQWNSLEIYEPGRTGLIHYTDMQTQPWVCPQNANGWVWLEEVRKMLESGALARSELEQEVKLGYFRPSLLVELDEAGEGPVPAPTRSAIARYQRIDDAAKFVKHRAVIEAIRRGQGALGRAKHAAAIVGRVAVETAATGLGRVASVARRLVR